LALEHLKALIVRYLTNMRWYTIVLALVVYALSSWLLLRVAGEQQLLASHDFIYWLVVTGSTVGYGDYSPTTIAGKYIVSLYIIPTGLSLFALILGRLVAWITRHWRKGIEGLKSLDIKDHILIIGWNQERTLHLLDLLLKEQTVSNTTQGIVLCVRADITNPKPGLVSFVKVDSFNKDSCMDRGCIVDAAVIILDNPEDDVTMTTSLYAHQRNPDAHKIAYFKDESLANLLNTHCPNIECTPSVAVEMLAKSAIDPGSSSLHYNLLNVKNSDTQYSLVVNSNSKPHSVQQLFGMLKKHYNATLIAARGTDDAELILNPPLEKIISQGDTLYYIAKTRITHIDWELCDAEQR